LRRIDEVIVHCSASDREEDHSVEAVRYLHMSQDPFIQWGDYETHGKGMKAVAYHFIIDWEGVVHRCRPIHMVGAHCRGRNEHSIGVCLLGNKKFTEAQKESFKKLTLELITHFGLSLDDVVPHSKYSNSKTCPNFDLKEVLS
jgi:N-acetylmuramoyl-L-alanine amidase